jgi:hypothetical protein
MPDMSRRKKPTSEVAEPAPDTAWNLRRYPEAAWGAQYAPATPPDSAVELKRLEQLAVRELPREMTERYQALVARRRAETLTAAEHAELLALTDRVEEFQIQRLDLLNELARMRSAPLRKVAQELGIIRYPLHA